MLDNQSRQIPYPGTAPFQDREEDRLAFFGRDQETRDLIELVVSESQVLLLARSGVGKTSLINAGLLEQLRDRKFFPISARIVDDPEGGPTAAIIERITDEANKCKVEITGKQDGSSLWAYFDRVTFARPGGPNGTSVALKPVLVIDQFEELFTLLRKDRRERFVNELADLIYSRAPRSVRDEALKMLDTTADNDPNRARLVAIAYGRPVFEVKVLFSIREDFLAELEGLKTSIPDIFRHTYRLSPLTSAQARDAIIKPAQQKLLLGEQTVEFEPAAVDAMIDFLCGQQAGGSMVQSSDIEPVQLQILCRSHVELALRRGRKKISRADLGGEKGMQRVLRQYYFHVLKSLPSVRPGWNARKYRPSLSNLWLLNLPRYAAQQLCESGLILPNGVRNSLEGGYISSNFGVPEVDLTELVQQHLLRSETRTRGRFYELSHDSLTNVLLAARVDRRRGFIVVIAMMLFCVGIAIQPIASGIQDAIESYRVEPLRKRIADATLSDGTRRAAFGQLQRLAYSPVNLSNLNLNHLKLDEYYFSDAISFVSSQFNGADFTRAENRTQKQPCGILSLLRPGSGVDFQSANIANSKFDQSDITLSNFERATVAGTTFQYAWLSGASFGKAKISNTNYSGACLQGAKFDNAQVDQTTFLAADLTYADFSNAKLGKVSFRFAHLARATFSDAAVTDDTDFSDAEWWLARGWSRDQVLSLQAKFPYATYINTPNYLVDLNARQHAVDDARTGADHLRLASALNEIAWYRAMHQVDLEQADHEADEAVQLTKADPLNKTVDNFLDTKAFILLLRGRQDRADQHLLEQAKEIYDRIFASTLPQAERSDDTISAWRFHYAITLDYLGRSDEANRQYKSSLEAGYKPSYELLLTPRPARAGSQ